MARRGRSRSKEAPAVRVEGVNELLRLLNRISKEMTVEVRDASGRLASNLLASTQGRGPRQTARALASLTVARDRIPAVRSRSPFFYGAEFGGGRRPSTRQFPPHKGRVGYGLYPVLKSSGAKLAEAWADEVFAIVDRRWRN